jgi:hypothetical protein
LRSLVWKVLVLALASFAIFTLTLNAAWAADQGEDDARKDPFLTRRQKTILLNVGAMGGVLAYGLLNWDYGEEDPNFKSEGWFGRTTEHGGMDKIGHFWSAYAASHLIAYVYRTWDYTEREANLYGTLSSLGIQTFMEVADAFSGSGFAYEDIVMNTAGCAVGYLLGRYPNLKRKIDFRVEYTPDFNSNDFDLFTNYANQRYLMAIKADGFDAVTNPYLKYAELHLGYFARHYEDYPSHGQDNRRRTLYLGIGFNVSKFVQRYLNTSVFDYLQIPYTSFRIEYHLD